MSKKNHLELDNCQKIRLATRKSMSSLFDIFDSIKTKKGSPTDQQQDLLRGIIILGCAGLDSFLKQIVGDSLEKVRKNNKKSHSYFVRKTKELLSTTDSGIDLPLMSEILMSGNTEDALSKKIISLISDHSLQHYGELVEILNAFGLQEDLLKEDKDLIRALFRARNNIAHEFDYNFDQRGRGIKKREQRNRESTHEFIQLILKIMQKIEEQVNKILLSV